MLEPGHQRLLTRVLDATTWAGVADCLDDKAVIAQTKSVIEDLEGYPVLQTIVRERLETRTLISALRMRHAGDDTPGSIDEWGYGRWIAQIRTHWTETSFGLAHFMPWLAEADALLIAGDAIGMERLVLKRIFGQLERVANNHAFDFEAVVLYVMRWAIIDRWSRYSAIDARTRLETVVASVLSEAGDGSNFTDSLRFSADQVPVGELSP